MTHRQSSDVKAIQVCAFLFSALLALVSAQGQTLVRITQAVDDNIIVRVPNSTHPLTAAASDIGRVDGNVSLERMVLVLKPSQAQEAELDRLIDRQHDKDSADYQKWITPQQYGKQFGPSESDLNQVKTWLQQKGFRIDTVAHGRQWIEFSGKAGQVEQAFHTEMHHFMVKGEKHIANARDIALPQALAPVVSGILSLHDFAKKSGQAKAMHVRRDKATGKLVPDFTLTNSNGTFHFLTPGDYKKIYNTEPLLTSGINGAGVSIAIVARTDIFPSDVHTFRQIFGLPANDPVIITNGPDPGVNPDFVESSLDVEWSGAVAPGATIKLVTSARTLTTDGVDLSTSYIIDNAVAPIMSTSYSACEPFLGTAGNAHFKSLYRQAAAEGITAFVSTGDDGSATCDLAGVAGGPAIEGPAVSGLASTPYTVSVGGTQFNENGLDGNYWLANNRADLSSAVGYIPEQVWNESCDPTLDPNQCFGSGAYFLFAGGGGPSNCSTSTLSGDLITCISGTPKPAWQAGIGVPDDGVRDIPDLSLSAAGHDGYIVCVGGFCETTEDDGQTILTNADIIFGTSASTPAMAGIMALLEQAHGKWQGLANYSLYQLAAMENLGGCNASKITNPSVTSNCVFYDVTAGNNGVPGVPGYKAGKGYDMGTGLGSVNAANLVNAWDSAKKLKSKTALTVGVNTVQHGQAVPLQVVVKPVSGTGAPSGIFSLVPDGHPPVFGGALTHGAFAGNVNDLPGGDYSFKAQYAGDAMFGRSESGVAPIHVAPEDSVVTARPQYQLFEGGIWIPLTGPISYGTPLALSIDVHGLSQVGFANGKVEILEDGTSLGLFPLNEKGTALITVDQLPRATGVLPGHHVLTVAYPGNNSFKSSTSAGVPVVITSGRGTFNMYAPQTSTTLGTPVLLTIWVGGASIIQPTGTVRLTDNGKDLATVPLTTTGIQGSGFVQAVYTLNLPVGSHHIGLTYSGDSIYTSFIRFPPWYDLTVNPPTGAAAKVTLHQSPAVVTVGQSVNYTVAIRSVAGGPIPTGTVNLLMNIGESDSFTLPTFTPVPLLNGNATFTVPWYGRGRYLFVADYSGDAKYSSAESNMVVTVVDPATPTVTLTATPSGYPPNVQTELTAIIVGQPNNPNLVLPDGIVQFFDSVDGGTEQRLTGWHDAIGGTGQFSICVFQVKLTPGTHVLRARYLGNQPGGLNDWGPADSNRVTVVIQ